MNIPIDTCNTVIFDIGNVLVKYDWEHCVEPLGFADDVKKRIAEAVFNSSTWTDGDKGIYGKEDWCDAFIKNDPSLEQEIRKVYEALKDCILPTDYTEDIIRFFREKGYHIYYLSNYSEGLFEKTKETLSFLEKFDGGVFSWKEKCIKPDEKIYDILLKRYHIDPKKAIYFDDMEKNAEIACKTGMHGILFTPSVALELLHK
nr:HAD family phosphatase [uncultured Sellimonas sp.]